MIVPPAMRLALIRHTAPAVAPGLCYGRTDLGLRAEAAEDIAAVLAALGAFRPRRVWTSPARRCRVLADAVAARYGATVTPDPRLQEMDFGTWDGVRWDAIPRDALDRWAADPLGFAAPGGETGRALVERVRAFLGDAVSRDEDAAIVTHGGPLKVLGALARGGVVDLLAPAPPFGSVEVVSPPAPPPRR